LARKALDPRGVFILGILQKVLWSFKPSGSVEGDTPIDMRGEGWIVRDEIVLLVDFRHQWRLAIASFMTRRGPRW
jgi:hypothetical protein